MKVSTIKRIYNTYLSEEFLDFDLKGKLLYQISEDSLLKGYCFDSSGFDKSSLLLHVFIQPLFHPVEYVVLEYGERIYSRNLEPNKEMEFSSIMLQKMLDYRSSYLDKVCSISDFLRINHAKLNRNDPYALEIVAYSYIQGGDYQRGESSLFSARKQMEKLTRAEPEVDWYEDVISRINIMYSLVKEDPVKAKSQLNSWSNYTLSQLKLPMIK